MTPAAWTRCVCSVKRIQDSLDTLRLKTDEMRSTITKFQDVVDGVREAQEVVRNLQRNAADVHKELKVALKKRGKDACACR